MTKIIEAKVKTTQANHLQAAPSFAWIATPAPFVASTAVKIEKGLIVEPITPAPAPTKIIRKPVQTSKPAARAIGIMMA